MRPVEGWTVMPDRCCPIPSHSSGRCRLWGGGCEAPGSRYWTWCWPFGYLWDWILYGEAHLYQGMLIQHQSYYGNYACTLGGVVMSDDDEMDSCTWVPAARHVLGLWPCPVMPDSKCRSFPRPRRLKKSIWYWKLSGGATGCPGLSQVEEEGGLGRQMVKSCLPTSTVMRKRDGADCSRVQFFLGWWPLLFSQEWWGHIRYEMYVS
jgi:hypothetical protein